LRELYLLEEEIEIIETILQRQLDAMDAIKKVFDNNSYRITDCTRINAFKRIEKPLFDMTSEVRTELEKDFEQVRNQISKTAQVLRYNIEIAEEGDSKAILIFTIVTIIFMPLSFVAGLLGMNTSDIRTMDNNQSLFWEIALPLTAIIGGLSLLLAYKGTEIGDRLKEFREGFAESRGQRMKSPSPAKIKLGDEEKVDDMRALLPPPKASLRRRQIGQNKSIMPAKLGVPNGPKTRRSGPRSISEEPRRRVERDSIVVIDDDGNRHRRRRSRERSIIVEERRRVPGDDVVEVVEEDDRRYRERRPSLSRRRRSSPRRVIGIKEMFF